MVVICPNNEFPHNDTYSKYFDEFPYELSNFQKWSIKSIVDGNHSLITAHTGSGKTLPAEFAIKYFKKTNKKIIYASPLKALSNQKLYDFRKKFPELSFGILTGDIKDNPEADVLIMTTEILRNTLFIKQISKQNNQFKTNLSFDMDFENELALVCFDEIHFISDPERGSVWEQSIIMLPKHVQLLMLSATIDKPELFAEWIEKQTQKPVYLSSTMERVVPLNHYLWLTMQDKQIKIADKTPEGKKMNELINKKVEILNHKNQFNEFNYNKMHEIKSYIDKNRIFISRHYVLNSIIKHLYESKLLPAICFVLSRKNVEIFANEIELNLFDKDECPPPIEYECSHILYSKFDTKTVKDIMLLPEYTSTINLLKKGIAIHHAGIMPIIREMVELLFEKNYIKLLFATETFAVGINMPTKTVIFTGMIKYNGTQMRYLYPQEYKQMAGRAGRRGIDKIGYVIHCNNLFEMPSSVESKQITNGSPQTLTSKFKISFTLILNILLENKDAGIEQLNQFIQCSMMNIDIMNEIKHINNQIKELENNLDIKHKNLSFCSTTEIVIEEYIKLKTLLKECPNKKYKQKIINDMETLENTYYTIKEDSKIYEEINYIKQDIQKLIKERNSVNNYINDNVNIILNILNNNHFIHYTKNNNSDCIDSNDFNDSTKTIKEEDNIEKEIDLSQFKPISKRDSKEIITETINIEMKEKGIIASNIQETHSLALTDLYTNTDGFKDFQAEEIVGLLSCFTNITVSDENILQNPSSKYKSINELCISLKNRYNYYYDIELDNKINTGTDYNIHYQIIDEVIEWCKCQNEIECMKVIEKVKSYNISLGDFIKAILKINNIASEIEKICEVIGNVELLHKIKKIQLLTMKYVVNNISLYV
jgi:superfamily II RNA helicase